MHGWMEILRGLTGSKFRWMDFSGVLTGALFDWSRLGGVRPLAMRGESNWVGARPGQCSIGRTHWGVWPRKAPNHRCGASIRPAELAHSRLAPGDDTDD